jgi:iron complex transport system ATP-binding protein
MLKIENLSASYGKKAVIFNISAELKSGRFTAILGRNGSGKSSLLSCIGGIKRYSGKILLDECDISSIPSRERAKKLSYLPQHLPITQFTVRETVAFGREPYASFKLSEQDIEIIDNSIEKCGISHLKNKKLGEISGGERQMAYLAMTLAQDADVIMLDEPTTYMDAPHARRFLDILHQEAENGKSVVAVMHDLTAAVKYADNIILIDEGRIIFAGSREECIKSGEIERVMGVKKHSLDDGAVVFI